jgi:hypothetical protein
VTDGNQFRAHAAECFRLALLSCDEAEIDALSQMGCQWTDQAVRMHAAARFALRLVIN